MAGVLLVAACGSRKPAVVALTPIPTIDATARQLRVFDRVFKSVSDQYVRPDFNGVNWQSLGEQVRGQIQAGMSDDQFATAMRAMLANLPDNQATFETRAQRLEEETADRRSYYGIGAFISYRAEPEPHVVVLSIIADTPADKAGLKAHDSLYAVDGEPFTGDDEAVPAARIRGDADTSVTLTVQTPGEDRREVTIKREAIQAADVLRGGYLSALGVAYYRVPVAADSTLAQTIAQDLLTTASSNPLKGIILDLRVARSGDGSWPLQQMLTLFGNGDLGEFYTRAGTDPLTVQGQDMAGSQKTPMAILVGPDTAGSPEILAAALQSAGRAVLVGLPTPGAVEGFTEVPLPDGSRIFLATSSFRTKKNVDLASSGLAPDLPVKADWDQITADGDPVLLTAAQWLLAQ
jgi:carboxyl-terminal processing protease